MNMFEQMPFSEKYPVFRKLAEIGDLRKLSREELELYDEDIKNMRDIYATRKFDEKRGMEKGRAEGPFQKDFENLGDFRQKDFEEKNILCIFAPK